jgi:hypothetical protein
MTKEDIIRMAQEAEGIQFNYRPSEEFVYFAERFAALVAAAEREACAKLCDEYVVPESMVGAHPDYLIGKQMAFEQAARAIRARGEK